MTSHLPIGDLLKKEATHELCRLRFPVVVALPRVRALPEDMFVVALGGIERADITVSRYLAAVR